MSRSRPFPVVATPVCFVAANMGQGGAQRAMVNMANHWADQGRPVRIVTLDDGKLAPGYKLSESVKLEPLGVDDRTDRGLLDPRNFGRLLKFRRLLLAGNREVLLPMMEKVAALTLASVLDTRKRVFALERIDPAQFDVGYFWSGLRRFVYPFATRVVVQTSGAAEFFRGWLPETPVIIPNPVLPPPFQPPPWGARARTIAAAGRLDPQKGFGTLLAAFAASGLREKGWTLKIAGEGPLGEELRAQAAALGLRESVRFEGWCSDMPTFLCEARLFAFPSLFEGFPNALCEAMACGCACISSDCPSGPADIIRHGEDGVLVPPGSVNAMAAELSRLASDEATAARMGQAARGIALRFSPTKIMSMWDDLVDAPASVVRGAVLRRRRREGEIRSSD